MRTETKVPQKNRLAIILGKGTAPVKTQQALRAAGLATWRQKINIGKLDKDGKLVTPRSVFLGIARKLINLERRDHPTFTKIVRTKGDQSFEVDLNGKSWLISQTLPNGHWVMSDG